VLREKVLREKVKKSKRIKVDKKINLTVE